MYLMEGMELGLKILVSAVQSRPCPPFFFNKLPGISTRLRAGSPILGLLTRNLLLPLALGMLLENACAQSCAQVVPYLGSLQRIPAHEVDEMSGTIGDVSYSKVNPST
jgi:hypothetical protein